MFNFTGNIADCLKNISTDEMHMLEEKYKNKISLPNRCNTIIATNHKVSCPVSRSDRRYFALSLDNSKAEPTEENKAYFRRIKAVPAEALYKVLMGIDITGFVPSDCIPKTEEHREQKLNNLDSVGKWMYSNIKEEPEMFFGERHSKVEIYNMYKQFLLDESITKRIGVQEFWSIIEKILGEKIPRSIITTIEGKVSAMTMSDIETIKVGLANYMGDPNFFKIPL